MRVTETIPAAGKKKALKISGRSIMVESMGVYQSAADVPTIDMRPGSSNYPLYPRSTYPNEDGLFNSIEIFGTAASAGDEITFLSTEECLPLNININFVSTSKSIAGETFTKAASDSVQSFSELELADANNNLPKRLYIYVQSSGGTKEGINYAFDADPPQGEYANAMQWANLEHDDGAGVLQRLRTNEPLEIVGIDWILNFKFIATVAGEAPALIVTPEY